MEFESRIPHSAWGYKISAVYKITFDTGHYYIGCSEFLQSRASGWRSTLTKNIRTEYDFLDRVSDAKSAILEIVELCSKEEVLDREAFYLNKHSGDEMMLSKVRCAWKPVLQYSKDGVFIKKHVSISAAARYNSTSVGRIQDVLSGLRASHKEMRFICEANYIKPKRRQVRRVEKKNGRNLVAFDLDGNEVIRFKKIVEAAAHFQCSTKNIDRVLNGVQKTVKGLVLRYSE